MTNIVIDTNVLVSALLSPTGNPAKITTLMTDTNKISVFYSVDILREYSRVLAYEKLKISKEKQKTMIDALINVGYFIKPATSIIPMPDETDRIFYDTATTSSAILITGNMKHYPTADFIMTPTDFLATLQEATP